MSSDLIQKHKAKDLVVHHNEVFCRIVQEFVSAITGKL